MKINKLVIRNFGIINEEELYFDDGLFVFSGDNGEGKSTVLKALSLILFNRSPGKLSDYIQWGKSEAFVRCEFIHNNIDYQTTLTISSKGSERWLYLGDTKEELTSTSAVTEKLNEILDTKRAIASTTSFEHEIDLITTSPAERREYLKKVYDLSFKKESERIEADIQTTKEKSIQIKSSIDALQAQEFELYSLERPPISKSKYEELLVEIEFTKKQFKETEDYHKDLIKQLEDIKEWQTELIFLMKELESLNGDIIQKEEKIKEQTLNISNYESFDFSNISASYDDKNSELMFSTEGLTVDIKNVKNAIKERIPRQITALKYDANTHKEKTQEFLKLEYDIDLLLKKKENLKDGICPVCGSSFDSHDLGTFDKEIESLMFKKSVLEEELTILENKKKEVSLLEQALIDYSKELSSNEAKLENLLLQTAHINESKETELSNKRLELEKSIQTSQELIDLYEKDIKEKKTTILKYEDKLNKVKVKVESSSDIESQIEIYERKLTDINSVLMGLLESKELYEKVIADNENKKKINEDIEIKKIDRDKKVVSLQKEYEENEASFETYKLALKLLTKDFPSFVLSRLIDNLSAFTNEFLQQVYPKYTIEFKESKSSLAVMYNDVDVKLASGFEKQVFSFAYKYALGKIQNYNILFLDEVDSAASEENSRLFYETLAKMQGFFHQIFIITHKDDTKELLKNDFNAIVYKVEGGKIAEA